MNNIYYYSALEFYKIANIVIIYSQIIKYDIANKNDIIIILCTQSQISLYIIELLLKDINKSFILISCLEDLAFPHELNIKPIIENCNFIHWFSVNNTCCENNINKIQNILPTYNILNNNKYITKIPYGLKNIDILKDFAYSYNDLSNIIKNEDTLILSIYYKSIPLKNRICKIYCNAHLSLTDERHGNYRSQLKNLISPDIIIYQNEYLEHSIMLNEFAKYCFILSPYGNGLDCIRTFEALCLGCIPIIKKSDIDDVYNDLPVLIVDEWTDLNNILLNKILIEYSNKIFNYKKLTMKYWVDMILNKIMNN